MRFSPGIRELWKYIATQTVTNFENLLRGRHVGQYLKCMGCDVCVCMADLRWFSHQGICLHPKVRRSKYFYSCDWTVKQSHVNQTRGPTLSFRICLSSMNTDGPSASNYIHCVKRALLAHDDNSRWRILSQFRLPYLEQCNTLDIPGYPNYHLSLTTYNKSPRILTIFKIRPKKGPKPVQIGLNLSKMFV